VNSRKRKCRVSQLLARKFLLSETYWHTSWNADGDTPPPVGQEFGSSDYDALSQLDAIALRAKVSDLIARVQTLNTSRFDLSIAEERRDASNVQAALMDLGHEVRLEVAAMVWESYSTSLKATWMSGAETAPSAKQALLRHLMMRPDWSENVGTLLSDAVTVTNDAFNEMIAQIDASPRKR
jgi:hypothetical protein